MKAVQTASTALRIIRAQPITTAARFSSSEAGPSSPSTPKPTPRRLPRPILRNLVELHHHSASFLQDPSSIPSGFKTAFNALHTPKFTSYNEFASNARNLQSRRPLGGLENFKTMRNGGTGAVVDMKEPRPEEARLSRSAWTGERSWSEEGGGMLTERETRVQEALYGTWTRDAKGRASTIEVGLDGVEEYMETRGETVNKGADVWEGRHNEA